MYTSGTITNSQRRSTEINKNSALRILVEQVILRSSRLEVFYKTGALKNLAKFSGKHLYQPLSF